ncbi:MAG: hypothetical protein Q9O24_12305 [Gammaproteobacteria bacterium]|nr:hypothetical protein [Gammaproteobacteria bacterium]
MLLSFTSYADLSEAYNLSKGEALAGCIERKIPIIDRIRVSDIRSYTKYDKHYISLSSNSIYVDYDSSKSMITMLYVKNYDVSERTKIEDAKKSLQNIKSLLFVPALSLCSSVIGIKNSVKFSMGFMDPAFKDRLQKVIVHMDESGVFLLP